MVNEQNIVVEGQRTKLGETLLDAPKSIFHGSYRYREDLLEKGCSAFAISDVENDALAASARDEEVPFGIPNALSGVDISRSFGDHPAPIDRHPLPSSTSFLFEHLRSVRLDSSSIYTSHIPPYEAA